MQLRTSHRVGAGIVALILVAVSASAQSKPLPLKHKPEPTKAEITANDLMTRLYVYADDSMMGRKAGTEANTRATEYIANELKKIGVKPGGERGTYFQNVPITHLTFSTTKPISVDGRQFFATKDFIPRAPRVFHGEQAIYGGMIGDSTSITPEMAAGKLVILSVPMGPNGKPRWSGTRIPSSTRYQTSAGIAIAGMDGMVESDWAPLMAEGADLLDDPSAPTDITRAFAPFGFMYITKAMAEGLLGASLDGLKPGMVGKTVQGAMAFDSTLAVPGRNVIGIIE